MTVFRFAQKIMQDIYSASMGAAKEYDTHLQVCGLRRLALDDALRKRLVQGHALVRLLSLQVDASLVGYRQSVSA